VGLSSLQSSRWRLVRRLALAGSIVAVVSIAATATLLYSHRTSHAAGAGCDIPANQKSATCNYSGRTAIAFYDSIGGDGCTETSAFILVSDGTSRNPSFAVSSGTSVDVSLFVGNACDPSQPALVDAIGHADDVSFSIDKQLNAALLNATVTVTDYAQAGPTTYPLTVNLTWTGYGTTAESTSGATHQRFGNWIINGHFQGDFRSATVSGSISDGSTDYGAVPVVSASLQDAHGGWVFIQH
jgi:hypothetical protein